MNIESEQFSRNCETCGFDRSLGFLSREDCTLSQFVMLFVTFTSRGGIHSAELRDASSCVGY